LSIPSKRLQRKFIEGVRLLLVRGNRFGLFKFTGMRVYDLMRIIIKKRFALVPGVRAVYLCHGLAVGECYPGLSDFDIRIVFESSDPLSFYRRIRRKWISLRWLFPVNDLSILTVLEFEQWQKIGGGWDPLEEIRHWQLLAGQELRGETLHSTVNVFEMDRIQWILGHFQNLLQVVLKEEMRTPLMAIVARRQLYKSFWYVVLALNPKYLAIGTHQERIARWVQDNGLPEPVADLQSMYKNQFVSGSVTSLRFQVAALAYRLINQTLVDSPLQRCALSVPELQGDSVPLPNHLEVEQRTQTMCDAIVEIVADKLLSIILSSNGTMRGYVFYIVFKDGLGSQEIADTLRDIRAILHVFDDPWFNEHFQLGIPTICSRAIFITRLRNERSVIHYFHKFRKVLYGPDLYAEEISKLNNGKLPEPMSSQYVDRQREQLLYSLQLHQIYLRNLKSALLDYITFYLPRLMLQRRMYSVPATAEEAVAGYARLSDIEDRDLPRRMLEDYRGRDLDHLLRTMELGTFNKVWPLLQQGLYSRSTGT